VARVFVSHAGSDLGVAETIAGWLREDGHRVFLDHDLEDGLKVGDVWGKRLFEELYQADALVAVVTAAFGQAQWCAAEVGIALANGVRLLPVRAESGASHRLIGEDVQWTEWEPAGRTARTDLLKVLRGMDGADAAAWSAAPLIYPGLDAFTAGQARVFFGRDGESRQLVERLRALARPAERGLLAVVGPSGCGKSSLVRAGLVPRLAGDRDWLVLPALVPAASPVADPVGELIRMLAGAGRHRGFDWTIDHVSENLARPGGITRLAAELLADAAPARQLLIVIDQVEELLDSDIPEPQRKRFAELLLEATGGPVRAVATIRTEFLDPLSVLAAETGLPVATFLVQPLARDMLPLVITGPARHAGIDISDELVGRLVTDTGSGEALPLLAYILNQLAIGVTRGGALPAERYDALGGVRGALSRQADAALAEAAATTSRSTTDVLAGLLRLVTINDDGQPTRRRAELANLPSHIRTELDVFVNQRLLTIHRPDVDGDSACLVIDIAHEQILTTWRPLADTITAAADILRLQADVIDAAIAWDRDNRPTSHLWELDRSRRATRYLNPNDLSRTTQEFLTASRRRGQRRRLRATAILTVLLLLVTAGGITALIQRNRAVVERQQAVVQRQQAVEQEKHAAARGLIMQAEQLRDSNSVRALRLGLAAEILASGPETQASIEATLAATRWISNVNDQDHHYDQHPNTINTAFSPDGRILVTTLRFIDRPGGQLRLWDISNPRNPIRIASIDDDQDLTAASFSPNGPTLATTSQLIDRPGGRLRLWDISNPRNPIRIASIDDDQDLTAASFSPNGPTLATTNQLNHGIGGRLRLWDISNPRTPAALASIGNDQGFDSVTFSPNGPTLATTSILRDRIGGRLQLWDISDPRGPALINNIDDGLQFTSVAFSPNRPILATTSALGGSGRLRLWEISNPRTPAPLASINEDKDELITATFVPSSPTLAIISRPIFGSGWQLVLRLVPWSVGGNIDLHLQVHKWACEAASGGFSKEEWQIAVPGIPYENSC